MKNKKSASPSRLSSFRFAIDGIRTFFLEEPNARVHLLITVVVFIMAGSMRVSSTELILLIIVMGMVWIAEIFNTAIERIMDFISPEQNSKVGAIKDLSAAAVLVAAIIAAATGLIVFIPKIF